MKPTTTKQPKTKSNSLDLTLENCNSQEKIRKVNKSKSKPRKRGRPKSKQIPNFHTSLLNIEIPFYHSQAEREMIISEELFFWLVDEEENKLSDLERYVCLVLWKLASRIGETVNISDKDIMGNRVTIETSKKREGKESDRTITLTNEILELKDKLTLEGLIQEGYLLHIDKEGTTQKVRDTLRKMCERLVLTDLIQKWTKKKNKVLVPHMFRRGRLTQLHKAKILNKDQLASFVDHGDTRTLPNYLPQESNDFLDTIDNFDKGLKDPLLSNLRESNMKELMKQAFKEAIQEQKIKINV